MQKIAINLVLLFLLSSAILLADELQVYIHNKQVQGEIIEKDNEIYVPSCELIKMMRVNISFDNNTGIIVVNDNKISSKTFKAGNIIYLPLHAITRASGLSFSFNKQTGIVDVYKSTPAKQETGDKNAVCGAEADKKSSQQGDEKDKSQAEKPEPLTIVKTSVVADYCGTCSQLGGVQRGCRVFADVTNGRDKAAKNIVAKCEMLFSDGTVSKQLEVSVGNLAPGEKKEVIFYFPDIENYQVYSPKLTVKGL